MAIYIFVVLRAKTMWGKLNNKLFHSLSTNIYHTVFFTLLSTSITVEIYFKIIFNINIEKQWQIRFFFHNKISFNLK